MHPLFEGVDYGWPELESLVDSSQFDFTVEEIKSKGKKIYPKRQDIFKAFRLCPLNEVQVVILGQDPYHNGQATGLALGGTQAYPTILTYHTQGAVCTVRPQPVTR